MSLRAPIATRDFSPRPGEPWAFHVYGPAIRWNFNHPDRPIPPIAVHPHGFDFRNMYLVDEVSGVEGGSFPWTLGFHPDQPLPAGRGGQVVCYVLYADAVTVRTNSPWNWIKEGFREILTPPAIFIKPEWSKDRLYKEVLKMYRPDYQPGEEEK